MTAAQHQQQLGGSQERTFTLGLVQKEAKVGLAKSDLANVLGSPNIVTSDSQGRETWIYDKVASEASFSQDAGSFNSSIVGGTFGSAGNVTGNAGGNYSKSAGAASLSQRTLTVVIKFSLTNTVESVSYNSTRF